MASKLSITGNHSFYQIGTILYTINYRFHELSTNLKNMYTLLRGETSKFYFIYNNHLASKAQNWLPWAVANIQI